MRSPNRSTSRSAASGSSPLRLREGFHEPRVPRGKHRCQPFAKSLVHVRQLGGEIAHGAAAHALAIALRLLETVEEAADLGERRAGRIGEARLQRALDEA